MGYDQKYNCPICLDSMTFTERYPKAICSECSNSELKDSDDNIVTFCNSDLFGGFMSLHTINNTLVEKQEHLCWIKYGDNNIKCYADEARFGGIVIQVLE